MINLLPQCVKCGSPVTDSLEDEIEEHGNIKVGSYIKGIWTCNDCISASQAQETEEDEKQDTVGVASKSDVSPNTPRADE